MVCASRMVRKSSRASRSSSVRSVLLRMFSMISVVTERIELRRVYDCEKKGACHG